MKAKNIAVLAIILIVLLCANVVKAASVSFGWDTLIPPQFTCTVRVFTNSSLTIPFLSATTPGTNCTINGFNVGTVYWANGICSDSNGVESYPSFPPIMLGFPLAPSVSVVPQSGITNRVSLIWNAVPPPAATYRVSIYRNSIIDPTNLFTTIPTASTGCTVSNLVVGTTYLASAIALDTNSLASAPSTPVTFAIPPAPTHLSLTH